MDSNVKAISDMLPLEYLVYLGTLIFQTYTASIIIVGAFIGVDRFLYLREKYINWKTGRKKS